MFFHPRTIFKPQLTIRKLINSPVLSPTLLQIYCIGLILQFFWVWATICDPTNICVWLFFSKCIISGHINVLHWEQISHKQNKEHALLLFFVFFLVKFKFFKFEIIFSKPIYQLSKLAIYTIYYYCQYAISAINGHISLLDSIKIIFFYFLFLNISKIYVKNKIRMDDGMGWTHW